MISGNVTKSDDAIVIMNHVNIFPIPKPTNIPKIVKITFSRTIYMVTSLSKNPRTLIVANSRSRSDILIFVRLYRTTKAKVPDKTMNINTTGCRLL